ncbi:hypothetical protein AgCh_011852 [Apium graveolens]
MLYVYHQTPTEWDDDINNFREDCAYSDEEFNEIRRATRDDRLKMNEFEKEHNINNDSGSESYTSDCSADYDRISSEEESDREVCYATPSQFKKGKSIEEIFNAKTDAKDIKWKVGLVFAIKKEFKDVVRSSSMETGRPYQFLVDDLKRMINKCPTKPEGYSPPKTGNKRGRPKKKHVDDEVMVEEKLQSKEAATGEVEMMDDLLNQMENEDGIQEQEILNLDDDIEVFKVVQPKMISKAAMEFMPNIRSHLSNSTLPASAPLIPTSTQQSTSHVLLTKSVSGTVSKNVNKFRAPRKTQK